MNFNTVPIISPSEAAVVWIQGGGNKYDYSESYYKEEKKNNHWFPTWESPFISPSEVVVEIVVIMT